MAYSDFTLQTIEATFGIVARTAALFAEVPPTPAPAWLRELLERGLQLPLVSEKARSELIVMPILLGCRELSNNVIAIFSGPRLDVSPEQGLMGECDFILARTAPIPELRAPLITVVEAKKNDVESGIAQCVAQLIGARLFNEQTGQPIAALYGCVTTGEVWLFSRLEGAVVTIDRQRLYLDNLAGILGMFQAIVAAASPISEREPRNDPS